MNVNNGNSVISLPPPGGITRLGFQYQSPYPTANGTPWNVNMNPWIAHCQRWKVEIVASHENAGPAPICSNFWKISWIVPRLPSKIVKKEAARPLSRAEGLRVKGESSSPAPSSLSLDSKFHPIENAQIATVANRVGRMKLYAIEGTIPS